MLGGQLPLSGLASTVLLAQFWGAHAARLEATNSDAWSPPPDPLATGVGLRLVAVALVVLEVVVAFANKVTFAAVGTGLLLLVQIGAAAYFVWACRKVLHSAVAPQSARQISRCVVPRTHHASPGANASVHVPFHLSFILHSHPASPRLAPPRLGPPRLAQLLPHQHRTSRSRLQA